MAFTVLSKLKFCYCCGRRAYKNATSSDMICTKCHTRVENCVCIEVDMPLSKPVMSEITRTDGRKTA